METESEASSWKPLGRERPLSPSIDPAETDLCPCGEESLDTTGGPHVIGARCREQVARHVRRRFGSHRYAGRYAADVEDLIQDCYRHLLAPKGLASFLPDPTRPRADAFRGWLWCVVRNHCNNKAQYIKTHPESGSDCLESLPESRDALTPDQAFARTRLRELNEEAVAQVEPTWRTKGPVWSERFDVILQLVYERDADAKRAGQRLRINDVHLRQLKWKLLEEIRREVRKQVLDDLLVDPGLEHESIERKIDEEIEALFHAAYPGSSVWVPFSTEPEPEPEADPKPEQPEPSP